MKVVIYVRVSTDEQASSGLSLQAQSEKLTAYANLYDLEVVEVIEDAGVSAKTLNRPGLLRALQLLRSGAADGLLICKLDRLTRSVSDWQTLIDQHFGESAGKALFSLSDAIDTRTAGGRLVLNVLLSVAQWEREAIAERTRDVLQSKIKRGERVGSVQYGYRLSGDGKTLVKCDQETEVVTMIQAMAERKVSLRRIAAELNRRQVPTKKGRNEWSHTTVRSVIKLHGRKKDTERTTSTSDQQIWSVNQFSSSRPADSAAGSSAVCER